MSNWLQATTARVKAIEATLVCTKCGEINRPGGANLIELDPRAWVAICGVCAHAFVVPDPPATIN